MTQTNFRIKFKFNQLWTICWPSHLYTDFIYFDFTLVKIRAVRQNWPDVDVLSIWPWWRVAFQWLQIRISVLILLDSIFFFWMIWRNQGRLFIIIFMDCIKLVFKHSFFYCLFGIFLKINIGSPTIDSRTNTLVANGVLGSYGMSHTLVWSSIA